MATKITGWKIFYLISTTLLVKFIRNFSNNPQDNIFDRFLRSFALVTLKFVIFDILIDIMDFNPLKPILEIILATVKMPGGLDKLFEAVQFMIPYLYIIIVVAICTYATSIILPKLASIFTKLFAKLVPSLSHDLLRSLEILVGLFQNLSHDLVHFVENLSHDLVHFVENLSHDLVHFVENLSHDLLHFVENLSHDLLHFLESLVTSATRILQSLFEQIANFLTASPAVAQSLVSIFPLGFILFIMGKMDHQGYTEIFLMVVAMMTLGFWVWDQLVIRL
ncbi:hypothetical protein DSL72_008490 [Monilinia vaccinii-corymbosi]|uniref:Uncharacterized protein n=1 Tax=Monilinia vaccinii-corymbosi TaxID=61207 RepID=A0A8A3PKI4_9HELO|nr:hypothetical protein DSL72_008490 [Monilinia vaccinii-corymbosi]